MTKSLSSKVVHKFVFHFYDFLAAIYCIFKFIYFFLRKPNRSITSTLRWLFILKRSKIDILVKNRHFDQKSTFWSKIDILVKKEYFGQKSTFFQKIEILVKNECFGQKSIFFQKIEIWSKNNRLFYVHSWTSRPVTTAIITK